MDVPAASEPDPQATLAQARAAYLAASGLGDGGYDEPMVHLRFGPLAIVMPNTAARRRAVPLHDLHHPLAGYPADWRGECAISAWEVAGGCGGYAAAWGINLGGMGFGALAFPRSTFRAFARGCRCRTLYADHPRGESPELLATPVAAMRTRLGLDREPGPARLTDVALYAALLPIAIPLMAVQLAGMIALNAWQRVRPRPTSA